MQDQHRQARIGPCQGRKKMTIQAQPGNGQGGEETGQAQLRSGQGGEVTGQVRSESGQSRAVGTVQSRSVQDQGRNLNVSGQNPRRRKRRQKRKRNLKRTKRRTRRETEARRKVEERRSRKLREVPSGPIRTNLSRKNSRIIR